MKRRYEDLFWGARYHLKPDTSGQSYLIGMRQCVAAVVIAATSFFALADAELEQNLSALEAFSKRTEPLIEEAQENGEAYSLFVEKVGDVMARTQSAKAAMQSVNLSKLAALARSNAALGDQYVTEYQAFLGTLTADSSCNRPESVAEFNQRIQELRDTATTLSTLPSPSTEEQALETLATLTANSVLVATVPTMFAMQSFCMLEDAAPVLEQFGEVEADIVRALVGQAMLAGGDGFFPNDFDESDFDQDDYSNEEDFDDTPSALISDLTFVDPLVGECIRQSAEIEQAERVNELSMFTCDLSRSAKIALDDLMQFPYLNSVVISGGEIASLAPLSNAEDLSDIMVSDSTISSFGNFSGEYANAIFTGVTSNDWGALAQSGMHFIVIEQLKDCSQLASLIGAEDVVAIYPENENDDIANQLAGNAMMIATDCSKDSVF